MVFFGGVQGGCHSRGTRESAALGVFMTIRTKDPKPKEIGWVCVQWIFQVPVKGGRVYITPQEAIYKWYISGIYCQLGDYILPTTLYRNLKIPLMCGCLHPRSLTFSPLKNDAWKMILSFWVPAYFQGRKC